ncbi:hypothetical protein RP20_CCG021497 [Aedes albopictus]|nr:hypothetical protein RP20_CCG021497 [Aedes albopictus]
MVVLLVICSTVVVSFPAPQSPIDAAFADLDKKLAKTGEQVKATADDTIKKIGEGVSKGVEEVNIH